MTDVRSRRPFTIRFNKPCNNQGEIEISLNPPFKPRSHDTNYIISLTTFSTVNLISNLHAENNKFYYSTPKANRESALLQPTALTLPTGFYFIKEYNDRVKALMEVNKDDTDAINISIDDATGLVTVKLSKGYKVFFNKNNTFRKCLGFDAVDLTADGSYVGNTMANLQPTSHLYISCSACKGNLFVNDEGQCEESDILYSFASNHKYGAPISFQLDPKLTESVFNHGGVLNKFRMKFFDDGKNPVTFGGARVGVSLRVRMD